MTEESNSELRNPRSLRSKDPTERDSSVTLNPLEFDQLFRKIRAEFEVETNGFDRNFLHVRFFWQDKPYPDDYISTFANLHEKLGISKEDALKLYWKFLDAKLNEIACLIQLRDRIEFKKTDVEHALASSQKRKEDSQLRMKHGTVNCSFCGSEFKAYPYQIRRFLKGVPVFCGNSCATRHYYEAKKKAKEGKTA